MSAHPGTNTEKQEETPQNDAQEAEPIHYEEQESCSRHLNAIIIAGIHKGC